MAASAAATSLAALGRWVMVARSGEPGGDAAKIWLLRLPPQTLIKLSPHHQQSRW